MLRRGESKSSSHLGRRKSTSSIRKQDHIDPEISRFHAQAAATYAFARAQERGSANMSSHGPSRHHSYKEQARPSLPAYSSEQNVPGLRRQQSVRFAGPNAVSGRRSLGTRASEPLSVKHSTNSLRPRALTAPTPVPAAYRPPSRSSSIGKASMIGGKIESYVNAMDAYDEYYTKEDDVASTPSSYRRIRKSKSMLSEFKVPSVFFHNGTPESYRGQQMSSDGYDKRSQSTSKLRAPKSMNFLRSSRHRNTSDAAVQIARDKFMHNIEQQRLREQPSFIFRSRTKREEKPFRKSVRSSSATSYGVNIGSVTTQSVIESNDRTFKRKARKASRNFKNKIRGFFRRSDVSIEGLPAQQVTARNCHDTHDSRMFSGARSVHEDYTDIPFPDEATVLRVASRIPSLHAVPSNEQIRSRSGSVKSLRSNCSDKSRVTSWTSTKVDTAASRYLAAEKERQRLSIIQENGHHITSSSMAIRGLSHSSKYPAFHHPQLHSGNSTAVVAPYAQVNSARVYSALMQRLDENSPKAKLAQRLGSVESLRPTIPLRRSSIESFQTTPIIPMRTSSAQSMRTSIDLGTPATIRKIVEKDEPEEGFIMSHAHGHDDDVFISTPANICHNDSASASAVTGIQRHKSANSSKSTKTTKNMYTAYPSAERGDEKPLNLAPQQIAILNEPVLPKHSPRGLRVERGSGLFGNANFTIKRTQSPYRRALAEADHAGFYNPAAITGELPGGTTIRSQKIAETGSDEKSNMGRNFGMLLNVPVKAYTESIYSRTTSGVTPIGSTASLVPLQSLDDFPIVTPHTHAVTGPGDVVILERATYRPTVPSHEYSHRIAASTGSAEWRGWVSDQVSFSGLEKKEHFLPPQQAFDQHAPIKVDLLPLPLPLSRNKVPFARHRHVRESAQITDEDTDLRQRKVSDVKQPAAIAIQQDLHIPHHRSLSQTRKRSFSRDRSQVRNGSQSSLHFPQPQLLPQKSILKNKGSVSSINMINTTAPDGTGYTSVTYDKSTAIAAPPLPSPIPPPPPPPPPPLTRSPIRKTQSRASIRSVGTVGTGSVHSIATNNTGNKKAASAKATAAVSGGTARNVLTKRSNATLRSDVQTPRRSSISGGKLTKRRAHGDIDVDGNGDTQSMTTVYLTPNPGNGILAAVEKQFGGSSSQNFQSAQTVQSLHSEKGSLSVHGIEISNKPNSHNGSTSDPYFWSSSSKAAALYEQENMSPRDGKGRRITHGLVGVGIEIDLEHVEHGKQVGTEFDIDELDGYGNEDPYSLGPPLNLFRERENGSTGSRHGSANGSSRSRYSGRGGFDNRDPAKGSELTRKGRGGALAVGSNRSNSDNRGARSTTNGGGIGGNSARDHSVGSKGMVEHFLSSRRRRMVGSEDGEDGAATFM